MLAIYLSLLETEEQKTKLEMLYNTHKGMMYCVAFSVVKDQFRAEDIVHETFLNLIRIIDDIRMDDERETGKFLKVSTHNLAVDYLRKLGKEQAWDMDALDYTMDDRASDPETVVISGDNLEHLVSYVGKMNDLYRAPLTLRAQGYPIAEIAKILDMDPQTVKVRLHRARKMIVAEMEAGSNGNQKG